MQSTMGKCSLVLTVLFCDERSSLESAEERLDRSGEKNVSLYRVSLDTRRVPNELHSEWRS